MYAVKNIKGQLYLNLSVLSVGCILFFIYIDDIFYIPEIYITNILPLHIFHKTNTLEKQCDGNGLFLHYNLLNNGSVGLWHGG